ncbi:RNA polymerase sigma factor, partial [Roseisolibacter sp. H3M3-2]|uniref:RNA polymerase sigma factor n=1 Tax=Roseisolibacter sp. H3M3-2 TaxID=3031323 RepID=UPI0023DA674C
RGARVSARPMRLERPDGAGGAQAAGWGAAPDTAALVLGARDGDPLAFRQLVDAHYARSLRFARNMGLAAEDAEEAVQDTFVRVWNALPRFRPGAPFEPWLFRILANRCRSALVRRKWWRRAAVDDADEVLAQLPARWGAEGDDALYDQVRQALDGLPAEQREAFLLRHVEGMEYADMMETTGAGLSALKMRVKRASDALRARLTEAKG